MRDSGNFVTTKSVISLIIGIYIATGLAVLSSIFFLLTSLDRSVKQDRAHRVDIAMKLETRFLETVLVEYSYWDEAYENIIVDLDEIWVADNSGQYLLDTHGFDFSLAIKADGQFAYLDTSDDVEGLQFEQLMAGGLKDLIQASLQDEDGEGTVTGYIRAGADIYLVALSAFRDEETEEIRPDIYLSLGRRLDAEYIGELKSSYELPGLRLVDETETAGNYKALLDGSDRMVGRLTWSVEKPSLLIAPKVIGIVIPFFGLAIFLTRYFLKRDHADRTAFQERLYQEATLDSLTNISNRRHFMALGRQEIAIHKRSGGQLVVALFDIDYFKAINDTYGHAIGDKALVHLTQLCADELRESDVFGRIGGDEFAVILQETSLEEATEVLDRVRKKVEAYPLIADDNAINVTISMGLAPMAQHSTLESLLKLADFALYKAKKSGRNQVVSM